MNIIVYARRQTLIVLFWHNELLIGSIFKHGPDDNLADIIRDNGSC